MHLPSHFHPYIDGVPDSIPITPGSIIPRDALFLLEHEAVERLLSLGWLELGGERLLDGDSGDPRDLEPGDVAIAACMECIREDANASELPVETYIEPRSGRVVRPETPWERPNLVSRRMWFARVGSHSTSLELAANGEVAGLLVSQAISRLGAGAPGVEHFDPATWDLPPDPTESSVRRASSGYFHGLWSVCSCGLWEDSSTFLDVWGHVPILLVSTVDGVPASLTLLPKHL
jgi:hypothetical protein